MLELTKSHGQTGALVQRSQALDSVLSSTWRGDIGAWAAGTGGSSGSGAAASASPQQYNERLETSQGEHQSEVLVKPDFQQKKDKALIC